MADAAAVAVAVVALLLVAFSAVAVVRSEMPASALESEETEPCMVPQAEICA